MELGTSEMNALFLEFAKKENIPYKADSQNLVLARCPYCRGKATAKAHFAYSIKTGQFQCTYMNCLAHGTIETLMSDFNFALEKNRTTNQYRQLNQIPMPTTRPEAVLILEKYGISEQTVRKYHVTVQVEHPDILVFPFCDETNALTYIKYLRFLPNEEEISEEDFLNISTGCKDADYGSRKDNILYQEWAEYGCKPILFGMNQCDIQNDTLIITDGVADCLALVEAGLQNVISVPDSEHSFCWVPFCWDFLAQYSTIIVFGQRREERITLVDAISMRFHGQTKYVPEESYLGHTLPLGMLYQLGPNALKDAVENAVPVTHPLISRLVDADNMDISNTEKFSSGIATFDRLTGGFRLGQVIVVTGQRGEGKSTLVSQFGIQALEAGYNLFIYSGEMSAQSLKEWFERQMAGPRYINKRIDDYGYINYSVDGGITEKLRNWYADRVHIYDNKMIQQYKELDVIVQAMKDAVVRYGCKVLIIDNLLTAVANRTDIENEMSMQTKFMSELYNMALGYGILIFLVAHPRKKCPGAKFSNDDVSGAASITNLAGMVLRYGRPDGKPDAVTRELAIHKNRFDGNIDSQGIILNFEPASKRISEQTEFDWKYSWEKIDKQDKYVELPFV